MGCNASRTNPQTTAAVTLQSFARRHHARHALSRAFLNVIEEAACAGLIDRESAEELKTVVNGDDMSLRRGIRTEICANVLPKLRQCHAAAIRLQCGARQLLARCALQRIVDDPVEGECCICLCGDP